jgi:hypothetical protein
VSGTISGGRSLEFTTNLGRLEVSNTYRFGQEYVDRGSVNDPYDQFLAWINIRGSGMLNTPGIRPLKFVSMKAEVPAYLILITHEKSRGVLNPWEDTIDLNAGQIYYWGDAKYDRKRPDRKHDGFAGNLVLEKVHHAILDNHDRNSIPPILHFSKPAKGKVIFNGVCVLDKLELTWFEDQGHPIRNYRACLTILDIGEISVDWLHERANCTDINTLNRNAPDIWRRYLTGNIKKLNIYKSRIRDVHDQLPDENSVDSKILDTLRELSPVDFEKVIVAIFRQMEDITHNISGTRFVKDQGFDFWGRFILPPPLSYSINFLGEVKRYGRKTSVGPKDVSRLVARLNRGQYGIFVTTSRYTTQAQREVYADGYPVKLIAGGDLVRLMKELHIVQNGIISQTWLASTICPAVENQEYPDTGAK